MSKKKDNIINLQDYLDDDELDLLEEPEPNPLKDKLDLYTAYLTNEAFVVSPHVACHTGWSPAVLLGWLLWYYVERQENTLSDVLPDENVWGRYPGLKDAIEIHVPEPLMESYIGISGPGAYRYLHALKILGIVVNWKRYEAKPLKKRVKKGETWPWLRIIINIRAYKDLIEAHYSSFPVDETMYDFYKPKYVYKPWFEERR